MTDSKLWTEESDQYTKRALAIGVDFFDPAKPHGDESNLIDTFSHAYALSGLAAIKSGGNVLDVGCCAGGTLMHIHLKYPELNLFGIDPGKATVALFKEKNRFPKIQVEEGYSHQLAFENNSIDIVIFSMVLQWVPRKFLLATIAETDRVLKVGGTIVIEEFLPNHNVTSVSQHNPDIRIFKEDYPNLFKAFGWYKEDYRVVKNQELADDYRKVFSVIRKCPIQEAYSFKQAPVSMPVTPA